MKVSRSAARVALAVSAVLGLIAPAAAGEQVPFQGTDGLVERSPGPSPALVQVDIAGAGNAAQLGRFTFTAPHLVDTATRTAFGMFEFTSSNSETVSADFVGQATPTDTPGVVLIVETATITGGTGRFAGATGSFTVERLYEPAAGTTWGSYSGRISTPGAGMP